LVIGFQLNPDYPITRLSNHPILELSGVSKGYGGLRPLRIDHLKVARGERVALVGFDLPMAEVFVNLVTGATLPDTGVVTTFGRSTASITESADWLAHVDRFGIVSERAVLLDQLTVVQNLAVPFTLDLDPLPADVRVRATALGREVGLSETQGDAPVGMLDSAGRLLVRLGRALALDPPVLLLEHPTASVEEGRRESIGRALEAIARQRDLAMVLLTIDRVFAAAAADRVLDYHPANGRLTSRGGWLSRLIK
jgi:predicted ABC-type transport system involved in lysophospholipase L1 biosynthesis ATPase subunit